MKKLVVIFVASCFITTLSKNFSAVAQDAGYFSREKQYDAKIQPFCNNSPNKDFAPFLWNDITFITSSRLTEKNKKNINPLTKQPFLNVYAFDRDCNPVDLKFLPSTLNTNMNCGPVTIASDTSLLVITKNYSKANKEKVFDLYLAFYVRENNVWSEEKPFPFNNPDFTLQHPFFDDNTRTLYFSSNLPGGYGKFDLFKSIWDGKTWSQPENLGPDVNSPYNEVFPALTPDGSLIYTSDHPGAIGGLDLVLFKNGTRYLLPEPFNTTYDDFSLTFGDNSTGYFSSNRDPSSLEDNVYSFDIGPSFIIRVFDRDTKMPIPDVVVAFQAQDPPLNSRIKTSTAGEGLIYQGHKEPFYVSVDLIKDGYQPQKLNTRNFISEDINRVLTVTMEKVASTLSDVTVNEEDNIPSDYYIIVGSFRNQIYAQRRAEQLKRDFKQNIIILPKSEEGYYRLSNGKYSKHDEAMAASEDFKINNYADAWILRVKK